MNRKMLLRALLVALAMCLPFQAQAQVGESTGNIVGQLDNMGGGTYSVIATSPTTGRSRTVAVDADGSFRFSQLPVGEYDVTVSRDGNVVARDTFAVGLDGNTPARFALSANAVEVIVVTSTRVTGDAYATDSGLVLSADDVEMLPVDLNFTGVSMLAPGTVLGDEKFGLSGGQGLVSFGGSSVAENSCYINGLEVTNTRQGLGCGEVPFQFYQQFQVKTGGYSAQFGRTTGGVMNAVTKSGSNEWEFSAGLAYEPASLYGDGQVSRGSGGFGGGAGGPGTGRVFTNTEENERGLTEAWVTAGGPIIRDRLFVFAIVNPRDTTNEFAGETSGVEEFGVVNEFRRLDGKVSDNLFWGAKVDWDVTDNHRLSAWGYSNRNDVTDTHYSFDGETGVIGTVPTQTRIRQRGGEAKSLSYRGHFFDNITVSAMWGEIETEYTQNPEDVVNCPTVTDLRAVKTGGTIVGCGPGGAYGPNHDTNEQIRLDVEYAIGDHVVRAGYDEQTRDSVNISQPVGGHSWSYRTVLPGASFQTTNGSFTNNTAANIDFARDRIFTNAALGGAFSSDLKAFYLEDEWALTDNLVAYVGVRKDQLTNSGVTDVVFADFDQDWAPRLGFSWDPSGSGVNKFYGTYGRYYLPIANNTNFRVGAGVSDVTTSYFYTGVAADGQPTGITPMTCTAGNCVSNNSAAAPPTQAEFQAAEADPLFKDEFILGYERLLGDEYTVELSGVYRDTGATLDDYCGPEANQGYCTLVNPGQGGTWTGLDGVSRFHTAEAIGLSEAINKYYSVQLKLNHSGDRLTYSAAYVWAHSYGDFEGAVKSDITQADAGITQDFDFPALQDGAYGNLANDRRHAFKFYGNFQLAEDWNVGWNSSLVSGRPLSRFGKGYPDLDPAVFGSYGDTFYIFTNTCTTGGVVGACNFDPADAIPDNVQADKIYDYLTRGENGSTPWLFNLDASLHYAFQTGDIDWTASMSVYNVLDAHEPMMINEHAENAEGVANEFYGAPYFWQTPRHFRFSIEARF